MKEKKESKWIKKLDWIITLIKQKRYIFALKNINLFLKETNFERNYALFLKGMILGRLNSNDEGINLLNNLLKRNIKNDFKLLILISKGEILNNSHKYRRALYALERALLLSPDNHTALEYKAKAQMGLKKYTAALITFKKAHFKAPSCISAIASMGICYLRMKKYDQAIALFNKVLKIDNNDIKAMKLIFEAYYKKKNIKKAHEYIDKIMVYDKSFPWPAYKADILAILKNYEEALTYYFKALNSCKRCKNKKKSCMNDRINFIENYAYTSFKIKKYEKTAELIKEGLKLNGQNKRLLRLRNKLEKKK